MIELRSRTAAERNAYALRERLLKTGPLSFAELRSELRWTDQKLARAIREGLHRGLLDAGEDHRYIPRCEVSAW